MSFKLIYSSCISIMPTWAKRIDSWNKGDVVKVMFCYIMGDFNLDAKMDNRGDYLRKIPLKLLNDFALSNNLTQIVDFNTWSRTINGDRKESALRNPNQLRVSIT